MNENYLKNVFANGVGFVGSLVGTAVVIAALPHMIEGIDKIIVSSKSAYYSSKDKKTYRILVTRRDGTYFTVQGTMKELQSKYNLPDHVFGY